jgi:hypothetical protein
MKRIILVVIVFVGLNFLIKGKTGLLALFAVMLSILLFLINNISKYLKARNGIFANGKVVNYRKISFGEKDSSNYEIEIIFTNPLDLKECRQLFYVFLVNAPSVNGDYKVWINTKNIAKSLLIASFNIGWVLIMGAAFLVFGVLLFFFIKNIIILF